MALIDQANLAADATFQSQVRMAILRFAGTAIRQAKTANSRADDKVYALATAVIADGGQSEVARFAYAIAAAPAFVFTVGTPPTATDAAVNTAVSSLWSTVAGVTTFDLS